MCGVRFEGDWTGAFRASWLFNAVFWGWISFFAVIVFGINIGTPGLGAFLTGTIKFLAALVSPSLALCGVAQVLCSTCSSSVTSIRTRLSSASR